jgi:hypothetical protein
MFVSENQSFSLKSASNSKQETEKLFQMLEVKLGQERVVWQKSKSQLKTVRAASFFFLFLVTVGALVAFYFIFLRAQEQQRFIRAGEPTVSDH